MSSYRRIDSSLIFFDVSLHNCTISSFDTVLLELLCKVSVGSVLLADKKCPCCVLVDPVHDSGAQNAIDPGEMLTAVRHDCIDQSSLHMSGTWMHDHILWLIYHHQPFILIQDIKRDLFRFDIERLHIRHLKCHLVTRLRLIICLYYFAIYRNHLVFEKFLQIRSGKVQAYIRKIAVNTDAGFFHIHFKIYCFHRLFILYL